MKRHGAFVISLDFELHWGIRDQFELNGSYTGHLEGARTAIPKMLELFGRYDVAATWAIVGFLFARSKQELQTFLPDIKPQYSDRKLDPYDESLGQGEADDPLHYAPSLIEQIHQTPRQEIGTHTFSHYYCLEQGQTLEAFQADLKSAKAIASTWQLDMSSIIFPRNQLNPAYIAVLKDLGIMIYRGNEPDWIYQAAPTEAQTYNRRAVRLLDAYLPITQHHLGDWDKLKEPSGLFNIPSSRFLRPYSNKLRALEPLRLRRITRGIEEAAKTGKIYHLWWHPHNFGLQQEENLRFLAKILDAFKTYQQSYGMVSLNMKELVDQLSQSS